MTKMKYDLPYACSCYNPIESYESGDSEIPEMCIRNSEERKAKAIFKKGFRERNKQLRYLKNTPEEECYCCSMVVLDCWGRFTIVTKHPQLVEKHSFNCIYSKGKEIEEAKPCFSLKQLGD